MKLVVAILHVEGTRHKIPLRESAKHRPKYANNTPPEVFRARFVRYSRVRVLENPPNRVGDHLCSNQPSLSPTRAGPPPISLRYQTTRLRRIHVDSEPQRVYNNPSNILGK